MLTILELPKHHWNYFLSLEKELLDLTNHIEFCEDNYKTYSISLAKIILSSCSEIDVILQELCWTLKSKKVETMKGYRPILEEKIPQLAEENILLKRYQINSKPWENLKKSESPDWWKQYQKVKHKRIDHFEFANLENAINSVGALLIILTYFYYYTEKNINEEVKKIEEIVNLLQPFPDLITLKDEYYPRFLSL